jgi:SAM-dependent MidA family methyltransferase
VTAAERITQLIHREGPITFDRFMEAALYEEGGFFASGHGSGRAGRDFITSPEVGSLFGACVARALEAHWRAAGQPDPFLVVEAGAGNGRLAADVLRAVTDCKGALRYVLVERSPVLRAEQRVRLPLDPPDEALGPFVRTPGRDAPTPASGAGPIVTSLEALPALEASDCVVLANELLDNLPFGIAQRNDDGWSEVRVAADQGGFREVLVPVDDEKATPDGTFAPTTRVPIPRGVTKWFEQCDGVMESGTVIVIDYMTTKEELPSRDWLRTYREHQRGTSPLDAPGTQDITADVVIEQLLRAASGFRLAHQSTQADWLRGLGIDALSDEGARVWAAGAHRGDLDALAGRSRVNEAAALTDPAGLGAHEVVILER